MQRVAQIMRRMNNNRVIQIRKGQDLRIDVESASVVERQVQTLLHLKRRHEVAAVGSACTPVFPEH